MKRRIQRRSFMASVGAVLGTFALPAQAGSYLDRAALLVNQAGRDADYLRARLTDKDLAKVIHTLASARVKAASTTPVPKEVTLAHPHLLLVLENYERAAEGAAKGQTQRFLIYQLRARDEERVLRGVLKQLGWPLPDTK